jgi:hypothetical protein
LLRVTEGREKALIVRLTEQIDLLGLRRKTRRQVSPAAIVVARTGADVGLHVGNRDVYVRERAARTGTGRWVTQHHMSGCRGAASDRSRAAPATCHNTGAQQA